MTQNKKPGAHRAQGGYPMASIAQADDFIMADHAITYLYYDFSIIPLLPGDKKPCAEWTQYQHEIADQKQIDGWWEKWPDANIGIVTGAISNVVVLDVDGQEGLDTIKQYDIPKTPYARTGGGGLHYYFKHPGFECRNFARKLPGIDFRGDGGYVVAPPSIHPNGTRYEWIVAPWEVRPAECPDWLLDLLTARPKAVPDDDAEVIPEGKRNDTLTRLAGKMRRQGFSEGEIAAALLKVNEKRCVPPLHDEEVEAIAHSVSRYEPEETTGQETQAQLLVRISEAAELFHTKDGECWATIPVGGHAEHWPVRSTEFRRFLSQRFYMIEGKPPGTQAIYDALNVIEARAQFEGPTETVHTRLAKHGSTVYLDLANKDWEAVRITPAGWQVVINPPVKFRRGKGALPLPYPRQGDIGLLRQYVNAQDDTAWQLLVSFILACFDPEGPYPVLLIYGEQGSAKSTTARVIKELIDPSDVPLRGTPRDERDLAIAAKNAWVLAFDNVSSLPDWLSDAFCRLSTGAGWATRKLYTDDEEEIFNFKRPCVLNGITEFGSRHDLIDRALVVTLAQIPEKKRKQEKRFWADFELEKGKLLGAFLDAVAVGLKNNERTKLEEVPRMADFAHWVVSCEPALPWDEGAFLATYTENRRQAIESAIEGDPVATAIIELAEERGVWEGTTTELLADLEDIVTKTHGGDKVIESKAWPKAASVLGRRLQRSAGFLRSVGIDIDTGWTSEGRVTRICFAEGQR